MTSTPRPPQKGWQICESPTPLMENSAKRLIHISNFTTRLAILVLDEEFVHCTQYTGQRFVILTIAHQSFKNTRLLILIKISQRSIGTNLTSRHI